MNSNIVIISLGSPVFRRYFEEAKAQGRTPLSLNEAAYDVFDFLRSWCEENCQGEWEEGTCHYWFELPSDAMIFKLTHA